MASRACRQNSVDLGKLRILMTCNLPGDIMITHILPRLPAKTLVQNKIVNKTWYSLMENRAFQELHFDMTSPNLEDSFYIVQRSIGIIGLYIAYPNARRKIDSVLGGRMRIAIGSANGVICFTGESFGRFGTVFIMHNPVYLQEFLDNDLKNRVLKGYITLGFGYDSRNKDFKIVRIEQYEVSGQVRSICDLYSNNSHSWRTFEPMIDGLLREKTSGAYVNGALHWLAERENRSFIVSFDLTVETFREIMLPETTPVKCPQLHVWRDQYLAAIYYYREGENGRRFEIWMMPEYGVRESWERVRMYGPFPGRVIVRGSTKNGQLMLFSTDRNRLVMYLPDSNEAADVVEGNWMGSSAKLDVLNYKESLIKVKGSKMLDAKKAVKGFCYPLLAWWLVSSFLMWMLMGRLMARD